MIFDSGKDVFYTTSITTGKPILRPYLDTKGMVNRLNEDTNIFMEHMNILYQELLETTKELNQPAYVLEMVINEGKFEKIKLEIKNFIKKAKYKFFAFIDSVIRTFNEICRSNKKLIMSKKDIIREKSKIFIEKGISFPTWRYTMNDRDPYELLSNILNDVFYEQDPYETLYNNIDPSQTTVKDVGSILGKLIGVDKANLDTFYEDAKASMKTDRLDRTLSELGGVDQLFDDLNKLYDDKESLKKLKGAFTLFMDNFEHVYDLEYYNSDADSIHMKAKLTDVDTGVVYDSLYEVYQNVTTICEYSMRYLKVAINMTQEHISQTSSILKRILNLGIEQEKATSPISSIII